MILVLTHDGDAHAEVVGAELDRLGAPWLRFDPAQFPASASITLQLSTGRDAVAGCLRWDGHQVDLAEVRAVYLRRPGRPQPPTHLSGPLAEFVASESAAFIDDVFASLDAFSFPAPHLQIRMAQLKVRQLRAAVTLGFDIPDTVVGNAPEAVPPLYVDHGGRLVSKQVGITHGLRTTDGESAFRYTQAVRPRDLVHLEEIRDCPTILQEYATKELELRVTVVGDDVFAAAIYSQATHHTRIDWRRYDDAHTPVTAWDLPQDVSRRCVELVRALGLHYGAIDLVVKPDGGYVFLEVNPAGQYLWTEEATGLPISRTIASLLAAADRRPRSEDRRG